jgi:hypothetical protein
MTSAEVPVPARRRGDTKRRTSKRLFLLVNTYASAKTRPMGRISLNEDAS